MEKRERAIHILRQCEMACIAMPEMTKEKVILTGLLQIVEHLLEADE